MRIKVRKMISKKIVLLLLFVGFQLAAQDKKWTLEECVDYAIKNNISIKQSELDLKTSDIEKMEAIGGFLPTLSASANYSVNTGASINPVTNQFQNETFKSFSAGENSNITLFNGWLTSQQSARKCWKNNSPSMGRH